MEKARSKNLPVRYPDIGDWEGGRDLVRAFISLGFSEPSGFGNLPVSWQTIHYWRVETEQHGLEPGDVEALREMSTAYVYGLDEYRDKVVAAPYAVEGPADPVKLDRALRGALDALVSRGTRTKSRPGQLQLKKIKRGG